MNSVIVCVRPLSQFFFQRLSFKSGFTLVELAIVITIIGLLIGGVLKGQELLENARATSTAAQMKAYETAVNAFDSIYKAYPGDMPNAANFLEGCNSNCNPVENDGRGFSVAGDRIIGGRYPAGNALVNTPYSGPENVPTTPSISDSESFLFWIHLLKANLITGVTDEEIRTSTKQAWGVTHPAAKIGGGFFVMHNYLDPLQGAPVSVYPEGNLLIMTKDPRTPANVTTAGQNVLSPFQAWQLDLKLDDGKPLTGSIWGYGTTATCFKSDSGNYIYDASSRSKDCGVIMLLPR